MKIIARTPVQFERAFFVFHKATKDVIVPPTDVQPDHIAAWAIDFNTEEAIEADTIEELMADFDRLGLVMAERDTWDFPEKPIRVKLSDTDVTDLLVDFPEFNEYIVIMKNTTVKRNGNRYIYLSEIYPSHEAILSTKQSYSLDPRPE